MSFRGRIEGDEDGDVAVIQLRDLEDGYTRITTPALLLNDRVVNPRHLLQKGDLLFLAKGPANTTAIYEGIPERALTTSVFFVIRPNVSLVLPKFLQWFLNLDRTQSYFKINQSGTYTPAVNKEVLGSLEIPLPPIAAQEKIARLYTLEQQEKQLLADIRERRSTYLNSVLLESLNE